MRYLFCDDPLCSRFNKKTNDKDQCTGEKLANGDPVKVLHYLQDEIERLQKQERALLNDYFKSISGD